MLNKKKIGILGVGKIGGIIAGSLIHNKILPASQILGTTLRAENMREAARRLGITNSRSNQEMAKEADILILAVKPQSMKKILTEIQKSVSKKHLVISLVTAFTTEKIGEYLGPEVPVIRAMPNTACFINEGMTVLCPGRGAQKQHVEIAKEIFASIGRVEILAQEELMDAVTALSGSGPAYAYMIIESLAEGGVKTGLPRDLATILAAQAILGGAKMVLETGEHPAKLKDSVTTPAGITTDALMQLEEGGLRVALIKAVSKGTERAKEISEDVQRARNSSSRKEN